MYNFEYFPEEETINTTESEIEPLACTGFTSQHGSCSNLISQAGSCPNSVSQCSNSVSQCSNRISQGGSCSTLISQGGICTSSVKSCSNVISQSGTICSSGTASGGKDYDCVFDRNSRPCSGSGFQTSVCLNSRQIKTDPELRQAINLHAIRFSRNGATWVRSEFAPLASCAGGERNCTTCSGSTTQTGCTTCTNNAADGGGGDWCSSDTVRFQPPGGGGSGS